MTASDLVIEDLAASLHAAEKAALKLHDDVNFYKITLSETLSLLHEAQAEVIVLRLRQQELSALLRKGN